MADINLKEEPRRWMKIAELAQAAGLSRHTVHYYLKENLLPPPIKTGKTKALYTDVHLKCLEFARELRERENIPIAAVRKEVQKRFRSSWAVSQLEGMRGEHLGKKGEQQRQRLIETALELFSKRGYHNTHVSDITGAIRISKGTFYLYFKDKHDLFIAVFDHLSKVLTVTELKLASINDFFERMQIRSSTYFEIYKKYHKIFDIIRAESIGQEGRPELSIQAVYKHILKPVEDDIRKAHEMGIMKTLPVEPELISYLIFGALDFACYRLLMDDKYPPDILSRFISIWQILSTIDDRLFDAIK